MKGILEQQVMLQPKEIMADTAWIQRNYLRIVRLLVINSVHEWWCWKFGILVQTLCRANRADKYIIRRKVLRISVGCKTAYLRYV